MEAQQSAPMDTKTEADVGAVAFTTTSPAIACVFRERYSDFVVREVALGGAEVKLESEALPAAADAPAAAAAAEAASAAGLVALCGGDAALLGAVEALLADDGAGTPVLLPPSGDKASRTAQHRYCQRLPNVTTDTVDDGDLKRVRAWRKKGGTKRDRDGPKMDARSRADWPRDRPNFLKFTLYKENVDTMHAVSLLARALRCKPTSLGYAGTKDKRGATTQQVTVFKRTPEAVARAVADERAMERQVLRCGHFSYVEKPLALGDLAGNAFAVALRRATAGDGSRAALEAAAAAAAEQLATNGFVNYFGPQRFGAGGTCNSVVGAAVVAAAAATDDWRAVVDLALAPGPGDGDDAARSKALYANGDLQGALQAMPRRCRTERALLEGLTRHGESAWLNAFQCLPKNLQLMYVHAHQSKVFNEAASRRCAAHGSKAVVGDLVLDGPKGASQTQRLSATAKVKVLGNDDLARYDAFDVLLPLPGTAVTYPAFAGAAEAYASKLENYAAPKHSEYSLSGAYRHCFVKPADLAVDVVAYGARDAPLVATDDRAGAAPLDVAPGAEAALRVRFSLPTSSYATVCLRELTKQSFAKGVHARQTEANDAAK